MMTLFYIKVHLLIFSFLDYWISRIASSTLQRYSLRSLVIVLSESDWCTVWSIISSMCCLPLAFVWTVGLIEVRIMWDKKLLLLSEWHFESMNAILLYKEQLISFKGWFQTIGRYDVLCCRDQLATALPGPKNLCKLPVLPPPRLDC